MKKSIASIIVACMVLAFLAKISFPEGRVFAESEAGSAGTLAMRQVDVSDTRAQKLRAYLASYNSPLAADADTFIEEADKNGLDWKLVAAIAGVESTFGKEIPTGSYNAWGWGVFTGAQDGVHFTDWTDGITKVSEGLKTNYVDRGAKTVYDIGWMYAANGDSWSSHVRYFINQLEAFKPVDVSQLPVSI
jgi:hypothetical protein